MPLRKGKGRRAMTANIRELIRAGRPVKQAVAIAYRQADKARKGKGKGKGKP